MQYKSSRKNRRKKRRRNGKKRSQSQNKRNPRGNQKNQRRKKRNRRRRRRKNRSRKSGNGSAENRRSRKNNFRGFRNCPERLWFSETITSLADLLSLFRVRRCMIGSASHDAQSLYLRSEERRVGKDCGLRLFQYML